jgi:hypothetical protein
MAFQVVFQGNANCRIMGFSLKYLWRFARIDGRWRWACYWACVNDHWHLGQVQRYHDFN